MQDLFIANGNLKTLGNNRKRKRISQNSPSKEKCMECSLQGGINDR